MSVTTSNVNRRNLKGNGPAETNRLDFSKAFDSVPHKHLLQKLSHYEIGEIFISELKPGLHNKL